MESQLVLDSILFIGKVVSVKGRTISILVNKRKNSSTLLYNGQPLRNVSVGGYVKITKGFERLIGRIDGEEISEEPAFKNKEYGHTRDKIRRVLTVKLVGFLEGANFEQGVKELPLIDNECFLLTQKEIDSVHNFIRTIDDSPDLKLRIGTLASEKGRKVEVGINSLFASHIGIFGNTGSGKSYTLASIYNKLFNKYVEKENFIDNAKFLLFDFNGEYSSPNCITANKKVYNLTTKLRQDQISVENKIPMNESTLVDTELLSILSSATEKTQKPFVARVVKLYNKVHSADDPQAYFRGILRNQVVKILKMVIKDKAFSLRDYLALIVLDEDDLESTEDDLMRGIDWHNTLDYFFELGRTPTRQLEEIQIQNTEMYRHAIEYEFPTDSIKKIIHFFYLQLIDDVYNDKAMYQHVGFAINKLKSKTNVLQKVINFSAEDGGYFNDHNFIVINLNETNIDIKKLIPLLIAKHVYNSHKSENIDDGSKYLNLLIDEAHNILSYSSERESQTWKDYRLETFEEIIKEGRKFGVFLTISSQRPSDISDTIISQLHNYFIHRLINNYDIQKIERTISYLDRVSSESLSILPTGTCIMAGLSVHIPLILEIDKIQDGFEPRNQTIKPTDYWD